MVSAEDLISRMKASQFVVEGSSHVYQSSKPIDMIFVHVEAESIFCFPFAVFSFLLSQLYTTSRVLRVINSRQY